MLGFSSSFNVFAFDFEVNGVYYNVIFGTNEVEVTYGESISGSYRGIIEIPPKVSNNGTEYHVKSIGNWAFYQCSRLTSVSLPESIISINNRAFDGCQSLNSITIPNNVKNLGANSFSFTGLTSIELPLSVTSIGNYAFSGCMGLKSVTIHGNIKSISLGSFTNCYNLQSVIIEDGVEVIGDYAFMVCNKLESVLIPKSVIDIGFNAFYDCWSLKMIEVQWDNPSKVTVFEDVFERVDVSRVELIVPAGTKHLYEQAEVWKNFGNITSVSNILILPDNVSYSNGVLKINNNKSERIYLFSETGQLMWTIIKNVNPEMYYIGNFNRGIYIICGESGWSLKICI